MDDIVTYYKAYLQSINKSQNTIKQYGIDTQQFINFMKDHLFTFDDSIVKLIENYNLYLAEAFSSVASINRKKASLHHFLTFLRQRERINELPDNLLKPIKKEKLTIHTLSTNQIKSVSNYWMEVFEATVGLDHKWIALRNFCIVNIMLEIGLKPSEVVNMKWGHMEENEITIIHGKRIRKLFLSTANLIWLRVYRKQTEMLLPNSKEAEFVWLGLGNKQNEPITVKTIERIFQKLTDNLGFKVTATTLRYTLIDTDIKKEHGEQLEDLFARYGYSRKSVLQERLDRIQKPPNLLKL
ncbi:tyrosine-type recombinase/integrase [Ureibacillus chungkukjangi]|uniref:Site-specific recombinase XerD n=1 Tax=Ureibacillus chungkukjangi TaxID=1202712 RepID=A0A318TM30_9BACL|nr:tyrosine-type recombinase/integrase [Ureibacillus chungkukjangi]PYF05714.1 site-specific recombinase XerD [Ureibacillus chungkukjangi]